jgi:periplasmic protein TonB
MRADLAPVSSIPSSDVKVPSSSVTLPLEAPSARIAPRVGPQRPAAVPATHPLFSGSLLELSDTRPPKPIRKVFVSVGLHLVVLTVIILIPLYFTDALDLTQFSQTFLVAPPPPPPPPPPPSRAVAKAAPPRQVFVTQGKLLAPTAIPQHVAMLKEEALAPDIGGGEGVEGGVPGGQLGGVIGGVISSARANVPPPIPAAVSRKPVRVGGRVKPPRLLHQVAPIYPVLAKQTRIQGIVQIDAIIDAEGNVVEMQAVSGPPLLIPAALHAVSQWKYEPTYLNDQPIAIQFVVTVTFQLN